MQKWMQCLVWDDAEMKRGERGLFKKFYNVENP